MPTPQTTLQFRVPTVIVKPITWAWILLRSLLQLLMTAWATGAIYWSNLPWYPARIALAILFVAFALWALLWSRTPRAKWAFVAVFLAVVIWFITIQPSHDRPWRPDVAVMPRVTLDGDLVRFHGYRDFYFRSRNDFNEQHLTREVRLSQLETVDLIISYWNVGPVGHTFLSFGFKDAPPVCISIEVRPEVGEGFAPVASMFKQFELIYLVGSEQDLIGSRASHRDEQVYLYRLRLSPLATRMLFLVYLERINQLYDRPEFYHLLKNSCTINIVRHANTIGRQGRWDIRHLLNGWIDRYLFEVGLIYNQIPFEDLRARSNVTQLAKQADGHPTFSTQIRSTIPLPPPPQP